MESISFEPVVPLIEAAKARNKNLKSYHSQVKPILLEYASVVLGIPMESLTSAHLLDGEGEVRSELADLIRAKDWDAKYKQEKRSRVKQVVVLALKDAELQRRGPDVPPLTEESLPEVLKPLWPVLANRGKKRVTKIGAFLVKAMVRVVEKHSLKTHERLLTDLAPEVLRASRNSSICHPSKWEAVSTCFHTLRKKSGVEVGRKPGNHLKLEEFPSPLKEQVMAFQENAETGLEYDQALAAAANGKDISIGPLRTTTVRNYIVAIGRALYVMDYGDSLSIEDLMAIQEGEYSCFGQTRSGRFNPYTNTFRELQRACKTDQKPENYDSSVFKTYTCAVKAVAALTRRLDLVAEFKEVYVVSINTKPRDEYKETKYETFALKWIDAVIDSLRPKYESVLENGLYKFPEKRAGRIKAHVATRFCLFFVVLVTLRYMGFRQQSIRDCVHGKNIRFCDDGSIEFYWPRKKVKNDVEIRVTVRAVASATAIGHRGTHGILLDTLNSYNRILYPYILKEAKESGVDLEGQFFVRLGHGHEFCCYGPDTRVAGKSASISSKPHVLFYQNFRNAALRFINFDTLLDEVKVRLHPHFFRGLVMNWLYYELHLPIEMIADYLGDCEETLIKHYKNKSRLRNGTTALDEMNKRKAESEEQRAMRAEMLSITNDIRELKEVSKANLNSLKAAERLANEERSRRIRAEQLVTKYEADIAALNALLTSKDAEISMLAQQNSRGQLPHSF